MPAQLLFSHHPIGVRKRQTLPLPQRAPLRRDGIHSIVLQELASDGHVGCRRFP